MSETPRTRRLAPALRALIPALATLGPLLTFATGPAIAQSQAVAPAAAEASLRSYAEGCAGRRAYGIYLGEDKIGWSIADVRLGTLDEVPVLISEEQTLIRWEVFGEPQRMESRELTWYSLEGEGPILRVDVTELENDELRGRSARLEGDAFVIVSRVNGDRSARTTAPPRSNLGRRRELDRWLDSGPAVGERFESFQMDIEHEQISEPLVHTYLGADELVRDGQPLRIHRVRSEAMGMIAEAESISAWRDLRVRLGTALEIRAEEEEGVRELSPSVVDAGATFGIAVERDLGEVERLEELTLELMGLGEFELPAGHRQRVLEREGDRAIVRTLRNPGKGRDRLSPEERERYLAATMRIQSDHDEIRSLARRVGGRRANTWHKVQRLQHWVYTQLEASMARNASSALEVLHARTGDCTEYALLFVALARASGVPAREVGGLIYLGPEAAGLGAPHTPGPMFVWHAWAEIHDGARWVSIDPSWDQMRVDATHLKLGRSHRDAAWMNLLGRLEIRILDARTRGE